MDSKQFNRVNSNGEAAGREDSRWKDKRIAELERQKRELVELLEEYLLVKNRWEQEAHDRKVEAALAKIDKEIAE